MIGRQLASSQDAVDRREGIDEGVAANVGGGGRIGRIHFQIAHHGHALHHADEFMRGIGVAGATAEPDSNARFLHILQQRSADHRLAQERGHAARLRIIVDGQDRARAVRHSLVDVEAASAAMAPAQIQPLIKVGLLQPARERFGRRHFIGERTDGAGAIGNVGGVEREDEGVGCRHRIGRESQTLLVFRRRPDIADIVLRSARGRAGDAVVHSAGNAVASVAHIRGAADDQALAIDPQIEALEIDQVDFRLGNVEILAALGAGRAGDEGAAASGGKCHD